MALASAGACRPDRDPVGPRADVPVAGLPVFGHLVKVDRTGDKTLMGELIAVDTEGLWIWTGPVAIAGSTGSSVRVPLRRMKDPNEHVYVPLTDIRRLIISRYRAGPAVGATAGWAGGLLLLTLSHGFWLLISAPITIVAGTGATLGTYLQSKQFVHRGIGERRWASFGTRVAALRGYARFPQGVPEGWPAQVEDGRVEIGVEVFAGGESSGGDSTGDESGSTELAGSSDDGGTGGPATDTDGVETGEHDTDGLDTDGPPEVEVPEPPSGDG